MTFARARQSVHRKFDPSHPRRHSTPSWQRRSRRRHDRSAPWNTGKVTPIQKANALHELRIKRVQLNDALALALGLHLDATASSSEHRRELNTRGQDTASPKTSRCTANLREHGYLTEPERGIGQLSRFDCATNLFISSARSRLADPRPTYERNHRTILLSRQHRATRLQTSRPSPAERPANTRAPHRLGHRHLSRRGDQSRPHRPLTARNPSPSSRPSPSPASPPPPSSPTAKPPPN